MKTIAKVLALAALLAGATPLVHASNLNGSIHYTGKVTNVGGQLNFSPQTVTLTGTGTATQFTRATLNSFVLGNHPNQLLFTARNAANTLGLTFVETSYTATTVAGVTTYVFYGNLSQIVITTGEHGCSNNLTACAIVPGTGPVATKLTITVNPDGTYSADLNVTPEPNSLLLMGTGLLAVGFVALRRRQVATAGVLAS